MSATHRILFCAGAIALLCATALGAYGVHGLQGMPERTISAFQTAVEYQFYHGLGLIVTALVARTYPDSKPIAAAGWLILFGIVFFCGSIFATTFGAPASLGSLAPMGGISFMLGWAALAIGVLTAR
jgi:uncharacterized membrane protein YgdD (TMEM256/DUF423 family)